MNAVHGHAGAAARPASRPPVQLGTPPDRLVCMVLTMRLALGGGMLRKLAVNSATPTPWSDTIRLAPDVDGGWTTVEVTRRCGDKLALKRTRGGVFMTCTAPSGARRMPVAIMVGSTLSCSFNTGTRFCLQCVGGGPGRRSQPS